MTDIVSQLLVTEFWNQDFVFAFQYCVPKIRSIIDESET